MEDCDEVDLNPGCDSRREFLAQAAARWLLPERRVVGPEKKSFDVSGEGRVLPDTDFRQSVHHNWVDLHSDCNLRWFGVLDHRASTSRGHLGALGIFGACGDTREEQCVWERRFLT